MDAAKILHGKNQFDKQGEIEYHELKREYLPADSYVGVEPDYVVDHDWEVEKQRRELFAGESKEVYGTIENRLKWDPYFQKAMELFFIF